MRAFKKMMAAAVGIAMASCGGSDNDGGTLGAPCEKVTGTWHITDTKSSASTAFCDGIFATDTATVVLAQTGSNAFTWTETAASGRSFVVSGQGSIDACAVNVTLALSGQSQQSGYMLTVTGTRSVTFASGHVSGVAQVTATTSPQQSGTPCAANFATSGAR